MEAPPRASLANYVIVFVYGVCMCAVSGTVYLFGTYGNHFKDRLHWTQYDVSVVSTYGDLGASIFGLPSSLLVDAFGPLSSVYAAGMAALGFMLMRAMYLGQIVASPYLLALFMCISMIGCNNGYSVALTTNLANLGPAFEHRGLAVGILVAGYGLSAFLFSALFIAFWSPDGIAQFFVCLAASTGTVYLLGIVIMRRFAALRPAPHSPEAPISADLATKAILINEPALLAPDGAGEKAPLLATDASSSASASARDSTLSQALMRVEFWLLYGIMLISVGSGLCYINNVQAVMTTIAGPSYSSSKLSTKVAMQVSLLSIFNCSGRIIFGLISDAIKRAGGPRALALVLTVVLMSCGLALHALVDLSLSTVVLATACIALAYGGFFSVVPSIVCETFGTRAFAVIWSAATTAGTLGSTVLNLMFGRLYDAHHGDYHPIFALMLVLNGLALAGALVLVVQQRRVRRAGALA